MFSRIHNKLGTVGFVIAMVALIAALAGTAFAALPGLNSKQKKEVKKIAKQFAKAGPQGLQGAPGAAGPTGAQGKEGASGTPGQNGSDGLNGEAGACSTTNPECVLPPGATLTGTWSFEERGFQEIQTEVEGQKSTYLSGLRYALISISFPLQVFPPPAEFNPAVNWVGEGGPTIQCPGNYEEPEAAPGQICFYAKAAENVAPEPEPSVSYETDRSSGIVLQYPLNEEGLRGESYGTWAVTAHCPENEGVEEEC